MTVVDGFAHEVGGDVVVVVAVVPVVEVVGGGFTPTPNVPYIPSFEWPRTVQR